MYKILQDTDRYTSGPLFRGVTHTVLNFMDKQRPNHTFMEKKYKSMYKKYNLWRKSRGYG